MGKLLRKKLQRNNLARVCVKPSVHSGLKEAAERHGVFINELASQLIEVGLKRDLGPLIEAAAASA